MNTRTQLADALRALLPSDWRVIGYPTSIDPPDSEVVAVAIIERKRRDPAPNVQGSYLEQFAVYVIQPSIDPGESEDWLDDNLESVEDAIQTFPWALWTGSEKVIFQEQYPAYEVTLTIVTNKE